MPRKYDVAFQQAFKLADGTFIKKEDVDIYSDEDSIQGFVDGWNYRSWAMCLMS